MSKASKKRACPALKGFITSADCGERRGSQLACPADCVHNPFGNANYFQLLGIEERLDAKTLDRMAEEAPDGRAIPNEIASKRHRGGLAIHAHCIWKLFFAEDANKTTFSQRWEQSGFPGLTNDERVLFHAKTRTRMSLFEVHRVLDDGWIEGVDLLSPNPEPMMVQDRKIGSIASRFTTLLGWIYPMPHYYRVSGIALPIPDVAQIPAQEIIREIVAHLGGPLEEAAMRRWLTEHILRFDAALRAVSLARHQEMLAGMDAKWGKAVYELRAPFAQCREQLDRVPEVHPDDLSEEEQDEGFAEARAWLDPDSPSKDLMFTGRIALGRVLLGQTLWRLEGFGAEKLARLRRQFEQHLGTRIQFSGERLDDFAARLAAKDPAADRSLVPPRLLENPVQLRLESSNIPAPPPGVSPQDAEWEIRHSADRLFLDVSVPALDNHSPREAARDPALRPKLIRLMKQRVRTHDECNLKTGRTDDINWLLRELDLQEILFDAPPWRPPTGPKTEEDLDPADFYEESEGDSDRPPAPPLPDAPLDMDEAVQRLEDAMNFLDSLEETEEELSLSGATILEDAEELTIDSLTEEEFSFAIPFILQAWFALVPPGCRAPEIDLDAFETAFASNLRQIRTCAVASTSKKLEAYFRTGPQPGVTMPLLCGFLEAATTAPKKIRPKMDAQPVILALLQSVVEILDEELRTHA